MADLKRLITSASDRYTNLYFIGAETRNAARIASAFALTPEEALVCTTGSISELSMPFGKNVMLTATSLICRDGNHTASMPLFLLCTVFIYYDSSRKKLYLITPSSKKEIYSPRLLYIDRTSFELYDLLTSLQQAVIGDAPGNRSGYYNTLDAISSRISTQFSKEAFLSDEDRAILTAILKADPNNLIADKVLKEEAYRRFDPLSSDAGVHEKEFFSSYLDLIASDYSTRFYRVMISAYSHLMVKEVLPLKEAYLLCALSCRMNDEKGVLLYQRICTYLTENEKFFLIGMHARSLREKMDQCMSGMLTGRLPSETGLDQKDDMGFDCLHYALILEEKETVSALLKARNWGEGAPEKSVGISNSFYNYFFLASWHFKDTIFLKEVFLNTRPEAAEKCAALRRIRSLTEIATSRLSLIKSRLETVCEKRDQALSAGNPMAYSDYELSAASLVEEENDILLEIKYLKSWKKSTDDEIDDLYENALKNASEILSVLRETPHPMVKYLLEILESPDSFISFHATTPDVYSLLHYRNLYFLGTDHDGLESVSCAEIHRLEKADRSRFFNTATAGIRNPWTEKSSSKDRSKKSSSSGDENKKGSSSEEELTEEARFTWFSEAAMHDSGILKKEYHMLIKRYHPDETGDDSGNEILREIISEKDRIIREYGDGS